MARKRGFFAELNHQSQQGAKRREQAERQAARAQVAALRKAEQARRQAERAQEAARRAAATEAKQAEREAQRAYVEAREAEVAAMSADLAVVYEEIDGILASTLGIDDYVDLETLRQFAVHPPFEPGQLAVPTLPPPRLVPPPAPEFVPPPGEPKGFGRVLGGKKKYAEAFEAAQAAHQAEMREWEATVASIPARQEELDNTHAAAEADREAKLAAANAAYGEECRQRETEATESNRRLDQLIANLGYEVEEAIQEYVGIVLGNSVYPDSFPVEHEYEYDSAHRELTLTVTVPEPGSVPNVKAYKYSKAADEITTATISQKEQKDRYTNAVAAVALRTLHEVFEADRANRISTISLTVSTTALDQGTAQ